ncbi:hypothetical protein FRB96_008175 [Tulasnella sp. 330]|nr:hypothetical protein FRB96_008175 [Tulasnella sp. 330]
MDYNLASFAPSSFGQHETHPYHVTPLGATTSNTTLQQPSHHPTYPPDEPELYGASYTASSASITPSTNHLVPQSHQAYYTGHPHGQNYQYQSQPDNYSPPDDKGHAVPGLHENRGRSAASAFNLMDIEQPLPSEYDIMHQRPEEHTVLLQVLQERRRLKEIELQLMEERRKERESAAMEEQRQHHTVDDGWRRTGIQAGSGWGASGVTGRHMTTSALAAASGRSSSAYMQQQRAPDRQDNYSGYGNFSYEGNHPSTSRTASHIPSGTSTPSTEATDHKYASQRSQPATYSGYYNAHADTNLPNSDSSPPVIPLTQQVYSTTAQPQQHGSNTATMSAIADNARAAVTATVAGLGMDEDEPLESWDGAEHQRGRRYTHPESSSLSPPSYRLAHDGTRPPSELSEFTGLRLYGQGRDAGPNNHAVSSHGDSSDGSLRGHSTTPDHFFPMPPPSIALTSGQRQQQQQQQSQGSVSNQIKHPRLAFNGPNIAGSTPRPLQPPISMPTSTPGTSSNPYPATASTLQSPVTPTIGGKKPRKLLVERPIICKTCSTQICKLLLRGFADEMNGNAFDLHYECQKCVLLATAEAGKAQGGRGGVSTSSSAKPQVRKRTRQTEDVTMPTVCDVCVRTLGRGGLVPQVRDTTLNFTTEVICHGCAAKYQRCSDCGGGSGRVGVGKWRAKEVFEHGRKTCRLPHVRLGGGEVEISTWEVPFDLERYKGGRDLPALMNAIKTLWSERVLARLAIPEVLEGGDPDTIGHPLPEGEEPVQRSYADVEDIINKGWPSRERILRSTPTSNHNEFRRYLGLSWTKSRARRDRAAGKIPDSVKYPPDTRDVLSENVRRTNVLVPPASQLVGMWLLDWDMRNRTLLVSTSVPFETSDAEDKNIIGVGEVISHCIKDYHKFVEQHPGANIKPPQHLWVATRSISAVINARMNDTLTRRRGFLPVDEYLSLHPGTERSIFENPPDGHTWTDEPCWAKHPSGSPTSSEGADLEILVRWLGDDVNAEKMEEIKDNEYGKKSKEMQIANKVRRVTDASFASPARSSERQREENIRKNNELLLQLDVQGVHDQLGVAAASSSKGKAPVKARSTAKPAPRVKREAVDSELPLRRSRRVSRLAVEPNETPAQKRKRELRERAEDERQAELERIREAHKPRHQDLDFAILGDDLKPAEIPKLRGLLSSLCSKKHARAVGSGTTSRDDEITADDKLEELQTQARRARVRSRAKVTTDRVYSMAYHPETSKDVVFVGDKRGGLGIWEPLAVPEEVADEDDDTVITEGGRHWLLQPHWPSTSKSSVSGIKVDPIDAHSIITSAYDCTIRQTSFTSGMSREVFALDDVLIASFDLPPNGHEMWISDVSGCLSHVDLRQDKNHARRWDVNGTGQKIGCVSVNPVTPHILATASNDRTLKLWDARKLSSLPISLSSASPSPKSRKSKKEKPEEDLPAMNETEYEEISKYLESKRGPGLLRAEHPHKLSVSSAFWDPSGRRIVSTSYDDTLRERLKVNGLADSLGYQTFVSGT